MDSELTNGLYSKYIITKTDGSPVAPEAEYLVLRIDKDVWAQVAALRYADILNNQSINPDCFRANKVYNPFRDRSIWLFVFVGQVGGKCNLKN